MTASPTRRAVLLAAAPLAGLAGLAACAPGGQGAPPAANKTPATIRWRTATVEQWTTAAPLFAQQFPHITVEIATQETGWQEKNVAEWLAGTGPDVTAGFNQFLPEWSRKGLLQKLDDRIKRDFTARQLQDYSQDQWKFFSTKERGQHAMPFYLATAVLAYNKDLFTRAGVAFPDESWDWNKYADAMRRLSNSASDQFGGQIGATLPRLQERILQNMGAVVDPNDDLKCLLDQPPAIEAMQWHQDRVWRDNSAPQPMQRTGRNLINLGKVAMWEQGSWQLATLARDVGTQYEWDLAIYPRGKQRNTVATTDGWGVWTGTRSPDQAWDLMRFLQSDQWNEIILTRSDWQPSRKSFADRWVKTVATAIPQLRGQNVAAYVHGIANNYARPNAVFRFDDDVRPQLQTAINQTVDQNTAPLADTIRAAVAAANARLKQLAGA